MNEKFFDSLLTYSKEQMLKTISILLWISLFFISFNKFVSKLDYKTLISGEKLSEYFLSGDYVVLIAWFVCLTICYYILKHLLTSLLPSSTFGIKIFLNYMIPEEYKVPLLNVYYKKAVTASKEHVKKAVEFWDDSSVETNLQKKRKLDLITGVLLKFLFILFMIINNFSGTKLCIIIISIVTCVIFLLLLITSITSIVSKNSIHEMIVGSISK